MATFGSIRKQPTPTPTSAPAPAPRPAPQKPRSASRTPKPAPRPAQLAEETFGSSRELRSASAIERVAERPPEIRPLSSTEAEQVSTDRQAQLSGTALAEAILSSRRGGRPVTEIIAPFDRGRNLDYAEALDALAKDIRAERPLQPGEDEVAWKDESHRKALLQLAAAKTVGAWRSPVYSGVPGETGISKALAPQSEVVGITTDPDAKGPVILTRQESPIGYLVNLADMPQSAAAGFISGIGPVEGMAQRKTFLDAAEDEAEAQARAGKLTAPKAAGLLLGGAAATVLSPDLTMGIAPAAKGLGKLASKLGLTDTERAARMVDRLADARQAGKPGLASSIEADIQREYPALWKDMQARYEVSAVLPPKESVSVLPSGSAKFPPVVSPAERAPRLEIPDEPLARTLARGIFLDEGVPMTDLATIDRRTAAALRGRGAGSQTPSGVRPPLQSPADIPTGPQPSQAGRPTGIGSVPYAMLFGGDELADLRGLSPQMIRAGKNAVRMVQVVGQDLGAIQDIATLTRYLEGKAPEFLGDGAAAWAEATARTNVPTMARGVQAARSELSPILRDSLAALIRSGMDEDEALSRIIDVGSVIAQSPGVPAKTVLSRIQQVAAPDAILPVLREVILRGAAQAEVARMTKAGLGISPEVAHQANRIRSGLERTGAPIGDQILPLVAPSTTAWTKVLDSGSYVPEAVAKRILDAVATGTKAGSPQTTLLRYWKTTVTRGGFLSKPRYYVQNFYNTIEQVYVAAGGAGRYGLRPLQSAAATITFALQDLPSGLMGLPGVTNYLGLVESIGTAFGRRGVGREAAEAIRRGLARGGEAMASGLAAITGAPHTMPAINRVIAGSADNITLGMWQGSYRQLRDILVREGVLDSFESQHLQSVVRETVEGAPQSRRWPAKVWRTFVDDVVGPQSQILSEVSEAIGTRQRVAMALSLMAHGMPPQQAAQATVDALFDYRFLLSPGDKHVIVQYLIPFWAWQKGAQRWTLDLLAGSPSAAWRLGCIRRAAEVGPEVLSWSMMGWGSQDGAWDNTLGVDRESLTETHRAMYEAMVARLIAEYPDGRIPEDVVAAARIYLASPHAPLSGSVMSARGKRMVTPGVGLPPAIPGAPENLPEIRSASVEAGRSASGPSYYQERGKVVLLPRATEDLADWHAQVGRDATWSEVVMPESTTIGGLRLAASMVAAGIYAGSYLTGDEGRLQPILSEVLDPYRAPGVGDLLKTWGNDRQTGAIIPEPVAKALMSMGYDVAQEPLRIRSGGKTATQTETILEDGKVAARESRVRYVLPPGLMSWAWRNLASDLSRAVQMVDASPTSIPQYQLAADQRLAYRIRRDLLGLPEVEISPSEQARKESYSLPR